LFLARGYPIAVPDEFQHQSFDEGDLSDLGSPYQGDEGNHLSFFPPIGKSFINYIVNYKKKLPAKG
jgi:hypothetical protein